MCGPPNRNIGGPGSKPKPFSFIVNLAFSSKRQAMVKRHEIKVFCPMGKVYDPHLELCRTGIENGPNQTNFDKYRVSAWLKNITEISNWSLAANNYSKGFFLSGFTLLLATNQLLVANAEVEVEGKMYRVVFDIKIQHHIYNTTETAPRTMKNHFKTLNYFLDFTKPTNIIIRSNNFTIIKVTTRRLSCVHLQRFFRHEYVVLLDPEKAVYVNKTSETFERQEYYLTMDSEGYYEKHNGTIWVCTNFSSNGTKETLFEETKQQIEHVLVTITILALSLSVFLLSVLLITYCLIGELRTVPGINLMNLSVSLIFGQLLWLFGSGMTVEKKGCIAIALAICFAFLSSFFWMTIIAIDT